MAAARKKLFKFTTPTGVAIYPKLNTPDTKFKAEGEYKLRLRLDETGLGEKIAAELVRIRDEMVAEVTEELKSKKQAAKIKSLKVRDILVVETDGDTGEETGSLILAASMKASGVTKDGKDWSRKPSIFSASGKLLAKPPQIWGGSRLKLSVEAFPWYSPKDNEVGVKLYLLAAQVIELVSGEGADAGSYGFGAEEGYEADESESFPDGDDADGDDAPAAGKKASSF